MGTERGPRGGRRLGPLAPAALFGELRVVQDGLLAFSPETVFLTSLWRCLALRRDPSVPRARCQADTGDERGWSPGFSLPLTNFEVGEEKMHSASPSLSGAFQPRNADRRRRLSVPLAAAGISLSVGIRTTSVAAPRSSTATRPRTAIAGWAAGAAFKARAHGVRGNVMGWIRLAPSDRRAPQAGLDCSETASPPLSQTLWPFHKPQRLRAVAPARHCCDPAAPDRVLLSRGARVLPASSTNGTGRQHEHRPRQPDAGRQNVLASTHGGAVDAAPTQHHQSKPAAMDPAVR